MCITAVKFLGHLVNQQVLHELVCLEVLTLLLEEPTDDSVEVAVGFLKVLLLLNHIAQCQGLAWSEKVVYVRVCS